MNPEFIKNIELMYSRRGYTDIETVILEEGMQAVTAINKGGAPIEQTGYNKIMTIPAVDPSLAAAAGNPEKAYNLCIRATKCALGIFTKYGVGLGIILYQNREKKSGITSSARNMLVTSNSTPSIKIQLFKTRMFGFDLLSHRFQPKKFEIIKGKELVDFKKRFPDSTLHRRMKTSDPVAKYFRFPPKKIIRVTRRNGEISYLYVVGNVTI